MGGSTLEYFPVPGSPNGVAGTLAASEGTCPIRTPGLFSIWGAAPLVNGALTPGTRWCLSNRANNLEPLPHRSKGLSRRGSNPTSGSYSLSTIKPILSNQSPIPSVTSAIFSTMVSVRLFSSSFFFSAASRTAAARSNFSLSLVIPAVAPASSACSSLLLIRLAWYKRGLPETPSARPPAAPYREIISSISFAEWPVIGMISTGFSPDFRSWITLALRNDRVTKCPSSSLLSSNTLCQILVLFTKS